ncbi:uncharacterized protein NPIL_337891 [Nephila pilipes]|uniref:Uncharacterized protein n=1 Tax=Nephila pilipes TaxID=299642 RepID=A0A8X6PZR3_NEPPI|nr:uncharacterized protein NPIL_337891 [Nephila pilipes]
MDSPCYCIAHNKDSPVLDQTSSMDLDGALRELSLIRKYPRKFSQREERLPENSSSTPLCVVQMNSKFVTKFSLFRNSSSDSNSREENGESSIGCSTTVAKKSFKQLHFVEDVSVLNNFNKRRVKHAHLFKPYDILKKRQLRIEPIDDDIPAATAADRASPPTVSRQDSGNKSNPNSPVKSQSYPVSSGSSIVRSRSLDDLEISKLDLKDDCCYGRYDIDTVSQRISKLHVS